MAQNTRAKSKPKKNMRAFSSKKKSLNCMGPFIHGACVQLESIGLRAHNKVSSKGTPFIRSGHCRKNRTEKDQLYRHEIKNIVEQFFPA
jgi:hypothetical protein